MFRLRALRRRLERLPVDGLDDDILTVLAEGREKERGEVAGALWASARELSPDDRTRAIAALRTSVRPDDHPVIRANAIAALLALGADGALDQARAALGDPDWFVRTFVAAEIGHHGDPVAAPDLMQLLHDPEPMVRAQAVGALGNLRHEEALPLLEELERNEKDDAVKVMLRDVLPELRHT